MPPWSACQSFFQWDGSLRDIYVLGGGLQNWDAVLRMARTIPAAFSVDGQPRPLPVVAAEALGLRGSSSPLLSIDWEGIGLNAHFFDVEVVELDLDPRQVASQESLEALVRFLVALADATGRPVVLTPESFPAAPYLQVRPGGEFVVIPADDEAPGL